MLHLFAGGPSGMVFEHFRVCFHSEDLQVDSYGCFNFVSPCQITHILRQPTF
jgi:hypothetical protein